MEHRQCFYSGDAGEQSFAWLHTPDSTLLRNTGVVLCYPLGYEYSHIYRSYRALARCLAEAGFASIRFDYFGTGDSDGDLLTLGCLDIWRSSVKQHCEFLRSELKVDQIVLLGLRMGATLAADLVPGLDKCSLVLWNPCLSGRRFVREMRAISALAPPRESTAGQLECAGLLLGDNVAGELGELVLQPAQLLAAQRVLWITRDDMAPIPPNPFLQCHPDVIVQHDYGEMMAEPHYTQRPDSVIKDIVNWLLKESIPAASAVAAADFTQTKTLIPQGDNFTETPLLSPAPDALFGILCTGATPAPSSTLVIFANAGAVHHVGPNRVYVELARALASQGIDSFRFDFSNLGDSLKGNHCDENHPYPASAMDDISSLLSRPQFRAYQRIVIAGLCSGSHAAFHAALRFPDRRLARVVLINPLTFYWTMGQSLDIPAEYAVILDQRQFESALRNTRQWLKVFNPRKLVRALRFAARISASRGQRILRKLVSPRHRSALDKDLLSIADSGCKISFIFSAGDPGHEILQTEAAATVEKLADLGMVNTEVIAGADHTFSTSSHRQCLARLLGRQLLADLTGDSRV